MTFNINSSDMFLVQFVENGQPQEEGATIARGFRVVEDKQHVPKGWGTASWFDLVSAQMRMVEIKKESQSLGEKGPYRITLCDTNATCQFSPITKTLYDTVIKGILIPDAPELATEKEVQEYCHDLNPYQ